MLGMFRTQPRTDQHTKYWEKAVQLARAINEQQHRDAAGVASRAAAIVLQGAEANSRNTGRRRRKETEDVGTSQVYTLEPKSPLTRAEHLPGGPHPKMVVVVETKEQWK